MHAKNSLWRGLLIFYGAIIAVVFGLMVLSFPVGAYLVFNSNLGNTITHEFPLDNTLIGLPSLLPLDFQLGEVFIVLWSFYLLFFAILMFGPRKNLLESIVATVNGDEQSLRDNGLQMVILWLGVLVVISKVLELLQQSAGITTGSVEMANGLVQFFAVSAAPMREELGFRVLLIGVPLYFMLAAKHSVKDFFKTLWYPSRYTRSADYARKNLYVLITVSAVLFGLAHLFFGGWSYGKITQAMIGGWIIGWIYYRYGLHAAILMHWSANYFIFSYVYFGNEVWGVPEGVGENTIIGGIDFLLTALGIITIGLILQKKIREHITVKEQNSFKDSNVM